MNTIKITVEGTAASGKTRISYLVGKLLESHGFKVEINDQDEISPAIQERIHAELEEAIQAISQKTDIVIEQKQLPRNFVFDNHE